MIDKDLVKLSLETTIEDFDRFYLLSFVLVPATIMTLYEVYRAHNGIKHDLCLPKEIEQNEK